MATTSTLSWKTAERDGLKLTPRPPENFYAALQGAGMPEVPAEFSVVQQHQVIASTILAKISDFIRAFDRVTGREAWQAAALREAPAIVQLRRPEVCFFSAWDFHLPPGGGWQLIEFNDNGSGFIFAAIINALYYEAARLGQEEAIAAPARLPAFNQHIGDLVEREARAFFGECPGDLFLVLDDAESLQQGKFRRELSCSAICCAGAAGGPNSDVLRSFAGTAGDCCSRDGR